MSTMDHIQWRNRAAAGLCSGGRFFEGRIHCMRRLHGVIVVLAKKREKGRTPSLAISCLTRLEENVSPQVKTELNARRTSRRGESHDDDVSKKTEGYNPGHDAWSNIVAENFAKEHSGHIEVSVQSLIHRHSAQLSYGQPCPEKWPLYLHMRY